MDMAVLVDKVYTWSTKQHWYSQRYLETIQLRLPREKFVQSKVRGSLERGP